MNCFVLMSRKKEKCRAQRNGSHQEREIELVTGHVKCKDDSSDWLKCCIAMEIFGTRKSDIRGRHMVRMT